MTSSTLRWRGGEPVGVGAGRRGAALDVGAAVGCSLGAHRRAPGGVRRTRARRELSDLGENVAASRTPVSNICSNKSPECRRLRAVRWGRNRTGVRSNTRSNGRSPPAPGGSDEQQRHPRPAAPRPAERPVARRVRSPGSPRAPARRRAAHPPRPGRRCSRCCLVAGPRALIGAPPCGAASAPPTSAPRSGHRRRSSSSPARRCGSSPSRSRPRDDPREVVDADLATLNALVTGRRSLPGSAR